MSGNPPDALRRLDEVGDSELFTGRELKRLVLELRDSGSIVRVRWINLEEAAQLLGKKEGALRKLCQRWGRMSDPPIKVRKKTDATKSHWLLNEDDVYSLVRRRQVHAVTPVVAPGSEGDTEEAMMRLWEDVVTRNIGRT